MPATVDLSGIRSIADLLRGSAAGAEKVVQRARATLSRRLLVEARRDIQTEYALKASRIRDALSLRNSGDVVELKASGRGVGLINFPNSGGRRGREFRVEIKRGEGKRPWDTGTFVAPGLNGALQAWVRDTRKKREMEAGRYKGKERQPLLKQWSVSVAQMLRRPDRRDRLSEFAQRILAAEVERLSR
jgi:hypothetical protein